MPHPIRAELCALKTGTLITLAQNLCADMIEKALQQSNGTDLHDEVVRFRLRRITMLEKEEDDERASVLEVIKTEAENKRIKVRGSSVAYDENEAVPAVAALSESLDSFFIAMHLDRDFSVPNYRKLCRIASTTQS